MGRETAIVVAPVTLSQPAILIPAHTHAGEQQLPGQTGAGLENTQRQRCVLVAQPKLGFSGRRLYVFADFSLKRTGRFGFTFIGGDIKKD